MKIIQKLKRGIEIWLQRIVDKEVQAKLVSIRNESNFDDGLSERSNQHNFKKLNQYYQLRKFETASAIASNLTFEKLKIKEKLVVLKCFYSSRYGVLADQLLEHLCETVMTTDHVDARLLLALSERVYVSGFDINRKLDFIEKAKLILNKRETIEIDRYYSLVWMEYTLRTEKFGAQDPIGFLNGDHFDEFGIALATKFLASLKAFGHDEFVKSLVKSHIDRYGVKTLSDLNLVVKYVPDYILSITSLDIDIPLKPESVSVLYAVYTSREAHPEVGRLYTELYEYLADEFSRFNLSQKDIFLRFLLRIEQYDEVLKYAVSESDVAELIPVHIARGFKYLANDDFFSARDCFQSALREDPSDPLAAVGLRFALPRVRRPMTDILELRNNIGYGTQSAGRTGVQDFGGELTISLLMAGAYVEGQYTKSKLVHWRTLKDYYGDRFLNFERFPERSNRTLFVIGDEGVGDEIRTAQFYKHLSERFGQVTITCDPRLERIFAESFPSIKFVPVPRIRKLLGNGESFKDGRLNGFGEKIANYLTEECRSIMDQSDIISFGQNVFFNYFLNDIPRPLKGPYLSAPKVGALVPVTSKLRVGILWRSHLRAGTRKLMYLSVEDFSYLSDIEGVELWSIQHSMDDSELEYCNSNGIRVIEDVDLFNDFNGMAERLLEMDLVIGVSSVPAELAAALGVPVWMLGFSPENYYLRTAGGELMEDQYTLNSEVIAPPWIDFSRPRNECIRHVFEEVARRLRLKLGINHVETCTYENL